jgi:Tol biopolymer transport system component
MNLLRNKRKALRAVDRMNPYAIAVTTALLAITAGAAVAGAGRATPPDRNGQIAFQRYLFQDHPLQADIFVANADGSGERRVTRAPHGLIDGEPDWSPDGERIVFQRCVTVDGPCTIWSVNANRTGARRLTPRGAKKCVDETSPAFAPDGKTIAFECLTRRRGQLIFSVVVMDRNGGNRRVVVHGTSGAGVGRPQFSPDGRRLVFEHQNINAKPKNGHATYVVNLDGTGMRRVTPWSLRAGDHPDWSPDGSLILVRSLANGPDFSHQGNLYTVRPDGSGLRQLTHVGPRVNLLQNGSFSPDGTAIVFATTKGSIKRNRSNLPDVFTVGVDATGLRPVTRSRNWDGSPDWGPAR